MYKKNRRLTFIFLSIIGLGFFIFLSSIFYVDPLRIWHNSFICPNEVYNSDNMRYNALAFIDRADYNSVIFGSSMLDNTSSDDANRLFNEKFINISIRGSHFKERSYIMEYLLKHHQVKTIITTLDTSILPNLHLFIYKEMPTWSFLYDSNDLNNINVYLNYKMFGIIFSRILSLLKAEQVQCQNVDFARPAAFFKDYEQFSGGIKNFAKSKSNVEKINIAATTLKQNSQFFLYDNNALEQIIQKIDEDILKVVKEHPKTKFVFIIPPYSTAANAIIFQNNKKGSELLEYALKYILEHSPQNMKIVAYDDMDFTNDIANYIDIEHYSHNFNERILDWIAKNKGELNLENFKSYWTALKEKSLTFDILKFNQEIQKAHEQKM